MAGTIQQPLFDDAVYLWPHIGRLDQEGLALQVIASVRNVDLLTEAS